MLRFVDLGKVVFLSCHAVVMQKSFISLSGCQLSNSVRVFFFTFVVLILLLFVDNIAYWLEYVIIALLHLCLSIASSVCLLCFLRCEVREFSYGAFGALQSAKIHQKSSKINPKIKQNCQKNLRQFVQNYCLDRLFCTSCFFFPFSPFWPPFWSQVERQVGAKMEPTWASREFFLRFQRMSNFVQIFQPIMDRFFMILQPLGRQFFNVASAQIQGSNFLFFVDFGTKCEAQHPSKIIHLRAKLGQVGGMLGICWPMLA